MKGLMLRWVLPLLIIACGSNKNTATAGTVGGALDAYIAVKNALVSDDAAAAREKGKTLHTLLTALDVKTLSAAEKKVYGTVSAKLIEFSAKISGTSDIALQRTAFETLSVNMWKLMKASDTEKRILYYQYCPMRKASWISLEAAIRNPYYGASMLTCGQVSETKNK